MKNHTTIHHHHWFNACAGLIALFFMSANAHGFAGGDGSPGAPYQVANAAHLNEVRNHLGAHFVQTADINLDVAPWNTGEGWVPIGWPDDLDDFDHWSDDPWDYDVEKVFNGRFDGNGHTIQNLKINRASVMQGLFGIVGVGELRNVVLTNVSIQSGYSVGALAGQVGSGVLISRCSASGTIMGGENVGGLVGANKGSIFASQTHGTVTSEMPRWEGFVIGGLVGVNIGGHISRSFSTAAVAGHIAVGGLVAENQFGVLENCYATGSVYHLNPGGGLVAFDTGGTIRHCYALGSVPGGEEGYGGGALIGGAGEETTVVNSYWNVQTGLPESSDGGEGRSTAQMTYPHAANTYVDWDFSGVWAADIGGTQNGGYPYLLPPADPNFRFAIESIVVGPGGTITLRWSSVEGKTYGIEWSHNLAAWQDVESAPSTPLNVPAASGASRTEVTIGTPSTTPGAPVFFRVKVIPGNQSPTP